MRLQKGDVIKLKKGMSVYGLMPEKFAYSNRYGSDKLTGTSIKIGGVYENSTNLQKITDYIVKGITEYFSREGVEVDESKVITFAKENIPVQQKEVFILRAGEFVVVKTSFEGGGTGHGPHDIYPDGHRVFCKALKDGEYDVNGTEVNFYQSGAFTCMITDIKPIRTMEV